MLYFSAAWLYTCTHNVMNGALILSANASKCYNVLRTTKPRCCELSFNETIDFADLENIATQLSSIDNNAP